MADSPTDGLMQTLLRLRLCTPGDVRRCRSRVHRLTRDLPAFDSVWIDALQRTGRLTPFQARELDRATDPQLEIGPCVLVDGLGPAHDRTTFVARHRETGEPCVLKRLTVDPAEHDSILFRIDELTRRTRSPAQPRSGDSPPAVVTPQRCLQLDGSIVVLSRWIDGPSLSELLVRRGRMPHRVVLAVARQLAEGLAQLERSDLVHGDLRPENVRLDGDGRVWAVDAGLRPAVSPELPLREDRPDLYDGTAPELVGTGRPFDVASDVYAFGCLLWTLLAGRPPFPAGDVLGKLSAHRDRDVPDIGEIAPDTPPALVEIVTRSTSRPLESRPSSFRQLATVLGRPTAGDRRMLARFRDSFQRSVPRLHSSEGPQSVVSGRWIAAALVVAIAAGLALHDGLRSQTTRLARTSWNQLLTRAQPSAGSPRDAEEIERGPEDDGLLPLPEPDEDGVVELGPGRYRASELAVVGPMKLRGAPRTPERGDWRTVIVVDDEPLIVWAEELEIENVDVRTSGDDVSALVLARSQKLTITGSRFTTTVAGVDVGVPRPGSGARFGVAWKPIDERDVRGIGLAIRDVLVAGGRTAFYAGLAPPDVRVENVLKTGPGALIEWAEPPRPGVDTTLVLSHVTLRDATRLVHCRRAAGESGVLWIEAVDSVFDLTGENAALLAWASGGPGADRVQFDSRSSVTTPGVPVGAVVDEEGGVADVSDDPNVIVEGLTANRVVFAGSIDEPSGSVVERLEGPRIGSGRPGILADRLDGPRSRYRRSAN